MHFGGNVGSGEHLADVPHVSSSFAPYMS